MAGAALKKSDVPKLVAKVTARELTRRGEPLIRGTVTQFGKRAANLVSGTDVFNVQNRRVQDFIRRWGAERITGDVNRTTQRRIRNVLIKAIDDGLGYEAMGKRISHVFDVAEGSRAVMIARTEVARASNFATEEGYRQAGVDQKEWQHSAGGDNPREDHIEMDGQIVGIDEDFTSPSGNTAPYPGEFGDPGDDINCQCGVLPVVGDKRMRASSRRWIARFLPRLVAPWQRKFATAMRQGFKEQRKAVMAEFNRLADKTEEQAVA